MATQIFELFGKIAIDAQSAIDGIDDTVKKAENSTTPFENAMNKFVSIATKAGQWMAKGLQYGADAIGNLLEESLLLNGELEQGFGGVEAVFGSYAENIKEHAKSAYETMGLSIGQYYNTAAKMGSLFIGSGASIEEAFNMTTQAMQRAADMAALMGIDTQWAMDSVSNMAKGNYFMMDNLGVAMTETTLKAFALEKGIKGTWEEMSKGEQIGIAYQYFMENTAHGIGHYVKENETLVGSLTTAKSAWKNFLSGEMSIDEALPHFENAGNVIVERIEMLLPHLVTGLTKMAEALAKYAAPLFEALLPLFTEVTKSLIEAMPGILKSCGGALAEIGQYLMTALFNPAALIEEAEWSAPTPEDPVLNEALKNNKTDDPFGTKDYWGFVTDEPIPEGAGLRNYRNDSIDFLENYAPNIGIPAAGIGIGDLPSVVAALKSAVDTLSANVQNITVQGSVRLDSGALVGSLLPGINVGLGRIIANEVRG